MSIQEFLHLNEINEENDQDLNNHIHLQPHLTQRTTRVDFGEWNQSYPRCQIGSNPLKKRVKRNILHFDVETQIVANQSCPNKVVDQEMQQVAVEQIQQTQIDQLDMMQPNSTTSQTNLKEDTNNGGCLNFLYFSTSFTIFLEKFDFLYMISIQVLKLKEQEAWQSVRRFMH